MDQEIDVGYCVDENSVGGGCKHCKASAGKLREYGSKSNGFASFSMRGRQVG